MDIFDFYQEWVRAWRNPKQESYQNKEGVFDDFRKNFGATRVWDFFKRNLSVKNKLFIKAFLGYKNIFRYPVAHGEKIFAMDYVEYICNKHPIKHCKKQ